jgi:ribonuclease HI
MTLKTIATDGSCLQNPGGPSGWAWVADTGEYRSGALVRGTNQIAELEALLNGLRDNMHEPELRIESDSQYALKVLTTWGPGWRRKGWRNSQGAIVANLQLVKQLLHLADIRLDSGLPPIAFQWVKGHARGAHPLNEAADFRAGEAARFAREHRRADLFGGVDRDRATLVR